MQNQLAIVIPAYKAKYFEETLESIAKQTNKNFTVYIGNDCSPDNIEHIVSQYSNDIPIIYHRFEENLGLASLTKQWERCVELSGNEPYIWLFSDDDLMAPNAVESFYQTLEKHTSDVYRFIIELINAEGEIIKKNKHCPQSESGYDFLLRRLKFQVHSAITEFIFSRNSYNKHNGFVDFPLAWSSDAATMALFAENSEIYSIKDSTVYWRTQNSINISSSVSSNEPKIIAQIKFIEWFYSHYPQFKELSQSTQIISNFFKQVCGHMLKGNVKFNYYLQIKRLYTIANSNLKSLVMLSNLLWYVKVYLSYRNIRRKIVTYIRN